MFFRIGLHQEIAVRAEHEDTDVTALMAIARCQDLNILAMRSYCDRDGVVLSLVTNDPRKTARLLERFGYRCGTSPVVLIGPLARRGWAMPLREELEASGVSVKYWYAHRAESGQHFIVIKTAEDKRALEILQANHTLARVLSPALVAFEAAEPDMRELAA